MQAEADLIIRVDDAPRPTSVHVTSLWGGSFLVAEHTAAGKVRGFTQDYSANVHTGVLTMLQSMPLASPAVVTLPQAATAAVPPSAPPPAAPAATPAVTASTSGGGPSSGAAAAASASPTSESVTIHSMR
ncbi:hypothetical protein EON67_07080, partial [archaeon]